MPTERWFPPPRQWDRVAVRRALAFGLAVFLLLTIARSGRSATAIQVVFTVFVIVATAWIRGQYVESLGIRVPGLIPIGYAGVVFVVAVLLVVSYSVLHFAGAALAGIFLLYYLAGSGTTKLRQVGFSGLPKGEVSAEVRAQAQRDWAERPAGPGWVLTIAGAVAAVAGALAVSLPGRAGPAAAYLLLVFALLVLVPLGVALLSESGIRCITILEDAGRIRTVRWIGVAGLVVFGGVTVSLYAVTRSTFLVVALVVLALLTVALVSRTQADVAAFLAVIALAGVTPLPVAVPRALTPSTAGKPMLVAFGDSYMSGEGASTYYEGTDEGGGNQCRRSPTAWAAIAGQQRPFGRLAFLACSGARTKNIQHLTSTPRDGIPKPEVPRGETGTQLDVYQAEYGSTSAPGLVAVTIGGNDAGFSTIGTMCVAPENCNTEGPKWTGGLEQVRKVLRVTYSQISQAFPNTPVVVIPYPDPITLDAKCTEVALSLPERKFLHEFVTGQETGVGLNSVIRKTAGEFGFYYLAAMQDALADSHLQLCDKQNQGRPGLNFIGLRSVGGAAEQRFNPTNWWHSSLHPNERGHAALLAAFENWLPEQLTDLEGPSAQSALRWSPSAMPRSRAIAASRSRRASRSTRPREDAVPRARTGRATRPGTRCCLEAGSPSPRWGEFGPPRSSCSAWRIAAPAAKRTATVSRELEMRSGRPHPRQGAVSGASHRRRRQTRHPDRRPPAPLGPVRTGIHAGDGSRPG
jgi:lysophospholipase L1-like esterase